MIAVWAQIDPMCPGAFWMFEQKVTTLFGRQVASGPKLRYWIPPEGKARA